MLGANLANSRWSWGARNPTTNEYFLRVWKDHMDTNGTVDRVLVLNGDWTGSSAGFAERQRHVQSIRDGATGYGVICNARIADDSKSRTIASFDAKQIIAFGELVDEGNRLYATIEKRIPTEFFANRKTAHSTVVPDLKTLLSKKLLETTKQALVDARVGQGAFRASVLNIWNGSCCVTGSICSPAIRASHIKPWRLASDTERLDPRNGLPLVATLDALFDCGLISFGGSGELLISPSLNVGERRMLGLDFSGLVKTPDDATRDYLSFHRQKIYLPNQPTGG